MKIFAAFIVIAFFCPLLLSAETFVLTNGKKIEGKVLIEDQEAFRIIDQTGVKMTLKKTSLNFAAMQIANQAAPESEVPVSMGSDQQRPSVKPAVVFTNQDVVLGLKSDDIEESTDLRQAQRELNRLSDACRSAGASSPSMRVWKSTTYMVNGKPVTVSGYWAHPENIENAKRICAQANRAQEHVNELLLASRTR